MTFLRTGRFDSLINFKNNNNNNDNDDDDPKIVRQKQNNYIK